MAKKYKYTKSFTHKGKRYYVRGNTLNEVYEKKARKLFDLDNGRITYNGMMSFEKWAREAVSAYKAGIKDETRNAILYRLNSCVFPEIGQYPIESIKPLQLQRIMNDQAGKSKSHVTKLRQDLTFIFEKALDNKMILENPARNLQLPTYTDNKRRSLTDKERQHYLLVSKKDPRFVLFDLMLYCGCRPKEAIEVMGMDIQKIDGYNMLHIRGTKTANSDRFVPIPDQLYPRIRKTPKFEHVALTQAGRPFNATAYKRLSNRLRREMNISMGCKLYRNRLIPPYPLADDFVPYFFRHTYCTDLARKGVDIRTAQKLMGHADIKMTANIYTHVDHGQIVAAAELIGATKKEA